MGSQDFVPANGARGEANLNSCYTYTYVTEKKVKMPKKTKSCLLAFSVNV